MSQISWIIVLYFITCHGRPFPTDGATRNPTKEADCFSSPLISFLSMCRGKVEKSVYISCHNNLSVCKPVKCSTVKQRDGPEPLKFIFTGQTVTPSLI